MSKKKVYGLLVIIILIWIFLMFLGFYYPSKQLDNHLKPKIMDYELFQKNHGKIKSLERSIFHWGNEETEEMKSIVYKVHMKNNKMYKVKFFIEYENDDVIGYEIDGKKVWNEKNNE